jgi:hypothetical protein
MYQNLEHKKYYIIGVSLFMCAVIFATSVYIKNVQSKYVHDVRTMIEAQQATMQSIVLLTAKDMADERTQQIIQDCSSENRASFDTLLSNLQNIRGQQLIEVESLFNDCGDFYAVQNAVMVAKLEREYELYTNYISLLLAVDSRTQPTTFKQQQWQELVALENEKSNLSTQLVKIQGEIITLLRTNKAIASDEMQTLVVDGQKTREALYTNSSLIETLRTELTSV